MISHDTRPPWWSTDPQSTAWATPRSTGAYPDPDTGAHEAREEVFTDAAPSPSQGLQPSGREASAARHWTPQSGHGLADRDRHTRDEGGIDAAEPAHTDSAVPWLPAVTHRRTRPTRGWRAAVYAATGGLCNPGPSAAEAHDHDLIDLTRTALPGAHRIAVVSAKGGVGKTTTTACLGLTLAEHRGDRIVALDANPDAGTLADRLTGQSRVTVRDLLNNLDHIRSWADISRYTSLAGRLQVLASEQDPASGEAFHRDEYNAVIALLADYNNVLLTDCGTGLVHSAMDGVLSAADTLVIAGTPTLDGASRASKTMDWLIAHGHRRLVDNAVVALACDRDSRDLDQRGIRDHFRTRARAVVDIPADPHLALGGRITLTELRRDTRHAYLRLAAHVAAQFDHQETP